MFYLAVLIENFLFIKKSEPVMARFNIKSTIENLMTQLT